MMIQCDQCNVWQHGECMGIWGDEEAPDGALYLFHSRLSLCKTHLPIEYFCEECKPERHQALKKWLRSRGRNTYVVTCTISICMLTSKPCTQLAIYSTHSRDPRTFSFGQGPLPSESIQKMDGIFYYRTSATEITCKVPS